MLIIITNPSDTIQWMRLISFHKGISSISAQKIIDEFTPERNQLEQFLRTDYSVSLKGKRVNKEGIASIKRLQNLYKKTIMDKEQHTFLPQEKFPPLSELAQIFITYLEPIIKENYTKDAEDRIKDLHELVNFITPYKSINAFLEDVLTQYDLTGQSIEAGAPDQESPLVLSTIHQAKGLEWKVVFLMCLIEGQMPNAKNINDPDELEEERRLFYVACTRAKDYLVLTYPRFFPGNYRQDVIGGPSRFIGEIEDEGVFEEIQVEEEF